MAERDVYTNVCLFLYYVLPFFFPYLFILFRFLVF